MVVPVRRKAPGLAEIKPRIFDHKGSVPLVPLHHTGKMRQKRLSRLFAGSTVGIPDAAHKLT